MNLNDVLSKSEYRISKLHPIVAAKARELITLAYNERINIVIVQGLRTMEEQAALYAQGRTKPGNIVTNAKAGFSYHNYGLAIDYALLADDGVNVLWTVNDKWRRVAEIGKSLGFEWGGDWVGFKDYPHLQMTFGLTINNLLAGKRPPEEVIIEERDEDNMPMKLEDWQWDMLYKVMSDPYNTKQLDWDWMQKIVDRTLTASELAFLNTVLDGRIDRKLEV